MTPLQLVEYLIRNGIEETKAISTVKNYMKMFPWKELRQNGKSVV